MKKPFAQEGPERARISASASAFRTFLPTGTAHSIREGAVRDHDGNIVSGRRFVNARLAAAPAAVAGRSFRVGHIQVFYRPAARRQGACSCAICPKMASEKISRYPDGGSTPYWM
jgi:hypothetical protein